jgi:hypothetical protein
MEKEREKENKIKKRKKWGGGILVNIGEANN